MNANLQNKSIKLCQTCEAIESRGDDTSVQSYVTDPAVKESEMGDNSRSCSI